MKRLLMCIRRYITTRTCINTFAILLFILMLYIRPWSLYIYPANLRQIYIENVHRDQLFIEKRENGGWLGDLGYRRSTPSWEEMRPQLNWLEENCGQMPYIVSVETNWHRLILQLAGLALAYFGVMRRLRIFPFDYHALRFDSIDGAEPKKPESLYTAYEMDFYRDSNRPDS